MHLNEEGNHTEEHRLEAPSYLIQTPTMVPTMSKPYAIASNLGDQITDLSLDTTVLRVLTPKWQRIKLLHTSFRLYGYDI